MWLFLFFFFFFTVIMYYIVLKSNSKAVFIVKGKAGLSFHLLLYEASVLGSCQLSLLLSDRPSFPSWVWPLEFSAHFQGLPCSAPCSSLLFFDGHCLGREDRKQIQYNELYYYFLADKKQNSIMNLMYVLNDFQSAFENSWSSPDPRT